MNCYAIVELQSSLLNALRVAAERFEEDAKTCANGATDRSELPAPQRRLVEQFEKQAKEARELYNAFDRNHGAGGRVLLEYLPRSFEPDATETP